MVEEGTDQRGRMIASLKQKRLWKLVCRFQHIEEVVESWGFSESSQKHLLILRNSLCLFINTYLPVLCGRNYAPMLLFQERKKSERKDNTKEKRGKKRLEIGLGSRGRWAGSFRVSLEPVSFWRGSQPLAAHHGLGKVLRDDKAFLSLASTPVWQRILSFQGAMFGVWRGGTTRPGLPLAWCGPLSCGVWFPYILSGYLSVWFLLVTCVRNAGHHSRGGMLRGPAVCPWDAEKQILWLAGRLLASSEPGREPGLSVLGEPGRAWAESMPSPASGYAWLPNWLSLRLLFIQIRRGSGFADHLRFLSLVHWLAGWLDIWTENIKVFLWNGALLWGPWMPWSHHLEGGFPPHL